MTQIFIFVQEYKLLHYQKGSQFLNVPEQKLLDAHISDTRLIRPGNDIILHHHNLPERVINPVQRGSLLLPLLLGVNVECRLDIVPLKALVHYEIYLKLRMDGLAILRLPMVRHHRASHDDDDDTPSATMTFG